MSKVKLPNPHPLITNTLKNIDKSYLDKGCIRCRHHGLDVRVSPNSLDRAIKIMDTLIKTLEKRKAKVSLIKKDYKNITCVSISDVALEIDLYEKFNIIKKGEDRLGFNLYDYIPNGKLVLRIKMQLMELDVNGLIDKERKSKTVLITLLKGCFNL